MGNTQEDFRRWFNMGVTLGATHMIMVCDTYDYTDGPVYVMPGEDVFLIEKRESDKPMQKIMEVYNLSKDREEQISRHRCWEY